MKLHINLESDDHFGKVFSRYFESLSFHLFDVGAASLLNILILRVQIKIQQEEAKQDVNYQRRNMWVKYFSNNYRAR